jgi:uncharacterized protein YjiS (DUF1127 family)
LRAAPERLYPNADDANHAIRSFSMSTYFSDTNLLLSSWRRPMDCRPQSNSWGLLRRWRRWNERSRQRTALRNLAEDKHLLDDLGLTRQEALDEADRPFWD